MNAKTAYALAAVAVTLPFVFACLFQGWRFPRRRALEMSWDIHFLVKYAHDEHAIVFRNVEHNMRFVLEAPEIRRELLGISAEPGVLSKSLEALFQSVAVAASLLDTEPFYAVFSDFVDVTGGTAR
jgi:hypothetical protein